MKRFTRFFAVMSLLALALLIALPVMAADFDFAGNILSGSSI